MNSTVQIIAGLATLFIGGEVLIRSAAKLAAAIKISPLVVGLTVVAFGTSTPELAVSVQSSLAGNADIALGNVVGSNIFNVLLILGLAALIVPLRVTSRLIQRDVPIMIGASLLMLLMSLDGVISRTEGLILSAGIIVYTVWCVRSGRRENELTPTESPLADSASGKNRWAWLVHGMLIAVGVTLLSVGASWLLNGSVSIAKRFGVDDLIIGLTVVAAGTSLPEVVTSILAAFRGERDIAVGNVVGSNVFNILCVLGVASAFSPDGVAVSQRALWFDIPVMIAVAVACLPVFFSGNVINRWEGGLFLGYFVVYVTFLVLDAQGHAFSHTLAAVLIWFVLPLTAATLGVIFYRERSIRNGAPRN